MDVTKSYEFIGFRAIEVTKPYEFIGFGGWIYFQRPAGSRAPGLDLGAAEPHPVLSFAYSVVLNLSFSYGPQNCHEMAL